MKDLYADAPAIVRPEHELKALAAEINVLYKSGTESSKKTVADFRAAGLALLKVKESLRHGELIEWIGNNLDCTDRHARRMMQLAKTDTVSDLETKWKIISGRDDEADAPAKKKKEEKPYALCRPCRTKGAKKNCKACATLNEPDEEEEESDDEEGDDDDIPGEEEAVAVVDRAGNAVPEHLVDVFKCMPLWDQTTKACRHAAKLSRELEGMVAYKMVQEGYARKYPDKHDTIQDSSFFRRASLRLARESPQTVCPNCKGIEGSEDADICTTCYGKLFVIKDDLK